ANKGEQGLAELAGVNGSGTNGDRRAAVSLGEQTASAETNGKDLAIRTTTDTRRSDVKRGIPVVKPPFWGSKVVEDIPVTDVFPYLNENVLIRGQWRVRQIDMPDSEYQQLLEEKVYPVLARLKQQAIDERLLIPKVVYGYFPVQSQGNDLIVYADDLK